MVTFPFGFHLGVRMHNLKFHNIYPTGAFLPKWRYETSPRSDRM